jgi:hypothetical protein
VAAGIPDTYTFAKDFEDYIKSNYVQLYPHLLKIIERRQQFNKNNDLKPQVDVEQLLDTLRRLINRDKEPVLEFYDEKKFCSSLEHEACKALRNHLENFIREKVIVKDSQKLEYLKELLKFDVPLEIYTTNYDTCIEQLSYLTHRRYTDGFNIDWNEKNFEGDFDIRHYKLHGSVIWFENVKTKQCIKIPAQTFYEGKPVELKLIYGEDIEPLLLYPAQKVEYVEPLTDLQLMFKHRLFDKKTRFVIFVGYSFKDEYVARMLWDAARVNENLHVILISPNAQEIFEDKIRYVNRERKDPSRIQDRTICLPYTFKAIISQVKNNYVGVLRHILDKQQGIVQDEEKGYNVEKRWQELLNACIEVEFLSKAEYILGEKLHKKWNELKFDVPEYSIIMCFKGLMHSFITNTDFTDRWLSRLNNALVIFSIENLRIHTTERDFYVFFIYQEKEYSFEQMLSVIESLLKEKNEKISLLSQQFKNKINGLENNLKKLEELKNYLNTLKMRVTWENFLSLKNDNAEKADIEMLLAKIPSGLPQNFTSMETPEKMVRELTLKAVKKQLEKIFEGPTFQLKLE